MTRLPAKLLSFNTPTGSASKGVLLDASNAPREGSDAGSSEDLDLAYVRDVVQVHARNARHNFKQARRQRANGDVRAAQRSIGEALGYAAKAFWWSEDSQYEPTQHQLVHEIARWKNQNVGCFIKLEANGYQQRCTIALTHKRMGFSVGLISRYTCSICGQDLSECPHKRGRAYWVRGGSDAQNSCRVCRESECGHEATRLYRARVIATGTHPILEEVSIVARPANPEARLQAIPYSPSRYQAMFGPSYGMPIPCYICAGDCPGFTSFGK